MHSNRIIWKATKANAEAREKISEVRENCMAKQNAIYKRRNEIIKGIPHFWLRVVSMGVIIQVNAETKEKISEIRRNCLEMRKAIFDRRNEIIKGIPDFWMRVFSNHCMLKILVSPKDREIFGYLDSLRVEYLDFEDPRKGYSIKLKFRANPFFSNKQLKKTIKFSGEGTIRSKGTSIDWMDGKGPGEVHRIDENGIQRPFPGCSIFSWICFPEGFEIVLDQDWVANVIMEDLWTNPMQFLDAVESEDEDDEDREEEDYDEDEDDEDDDDEEDDD